MRAEQAELSERGPLVWLLLGDRIGDNAQIRSLAGRLGYRTEEKYLRYSSLYQIPNILKGRTLLSVKRDARSYLVPPWPDLVILCGRKSVAAARWIRRKSGGKTKLVVIGRPRTALATFDLVLTTPQYRLPVEDNVVELAVPLSGAAPEDIEAARDMWAQAVADLPRPRIALLVGGDTTTCEFDGVAADRLGRVASSYAKSLGGSLLVTTSPRTSQKAADSLIRSVTAPAMIHRWAPGLSTPNPYLGFIGMADEVIVTCDSASMMADAVSAKKPVLLFDVPMKPRNIVIQLQHQLYQNLEERLSRGVPMTIAGRFLRRLANHGYLTPPRNMQRLYRNVIAAGHASWLVDACVDGNRVRPHQSISILSGVERAVERIREMMEPGSSGRDDERLADSYDKRCGRVA